MSPKMMPILQFNQLNFTFPGRISPVINNLNYAIYPGDFIVLIGTNGSGKSTLLKLISREFSVKSNQILLENRLLNSYSDHDFSEKISVLTQRATDSLFTSLTVFENFLLRKKQKKITNERKFFAAFLADFNENLAHALDKCVSDLSGGEQQALALALCFLNPPSVLLLDEHTSALDPHTSKQIMLLTKKMAVKHHITCVMTTHDLEIAREYGSRILVMNNRFDYRMIEVPEINVLTREKLLGLYY